MVESLLQKGRLRKEPEYYEKVCSDNCKSFQICTIMIVMFTVSIMSYFESPVIYTEAFFIRYEIELVIHSYYIR